MGNFGFSGSGRPRAAGTTVKKVGGRNPSHSACFPGRLGPPGHPTSKVIVLSLAPAFCAKPMCRHLRISSAGGGQLKTGNFGFSGSGRPWATGATVKKVGGGDETPLTNCVMREPPPKLTISQYKMVRPTIVHKRAGNNISGFTCGLGQ